MPRVTTHELLTLEGIDQHLVDNMRKKQVHTDKWPGWEDSAVPPDRVGDCLRDLRGLFDDYGYDASVYG